MTAEMTRTVKSLSHREKFCFFFYKVKDQKYYRDPRSGVGNHRLTETKCRESRQKTVQHNCLEKVAWHDMPGFLLILFLFSR